MNNRFQIDFNHKRSDGIDCGLKPAVGRSGIFNERDSMVPWIIKALLQGNKNNTGGNARRVPLTATYIFHVQSYDDVTLRKSCIFQFVGISSLTSIVTNFLVAKIMLYKNVQTHIMDLQFYQQLFKRTAVWLGRNWYLSDNATLSNILNVRYPPQFKPNVGNPFC